MPGTETSEPTRDQRGVGRGLRDLVTVFAATIAVLGLVVGASLLQGVGQSLLFLAFGLAVLAFVWFRLPATTRARAREVGGALVARVRAR